MRVAIPHDLPRETVRERLRNRSHEMADHIPGGMAEVTTAWPSEDSMTMRVSAMGQNLDGRVDIEDGQLVFEIDLPPALGFVEPMIANAVRQQGHKLLTKD
ncbi:polyhydroxyalkanoic acid system family protein [Altererythrobacter sp. C41]|uniref:polyhydroxyalkanoic acid system family protein n=1 Tax=Altererythrobacter sp. C41 TaxID=2806021 RepID=UPI0019317CC1|nr:polyhydroxyalkanoic acid system family protein [Altererythrobacter sp. C41]MBM0170588.1 polyhydroxyalkanoic acid system family protein [Altererythrobacter sp. C41]